jgi:hypothetical protein
LEVIEEPRSAWIESCPRVMPCFERFGHGEVAGNDFDVRWQRRRRLGAMREGADRHARVY